MTLQSGALGTSTYHEKSDQDDQDKDQPRQSLCSSFEKGYDACIECQCSVCAQRDPGNQKAIFDVMGAPGKRLLIFLEEAEESNIEGTEVLLCLTCRILVI